MKRRFWKNRLEFYPYITMYIFWLLTLLNCLKVQNRPGILALALITIPSMLLIAIAAIKTYKELPSESA